MQCYIIRIIFKQEMHLLASCVNLEYVKPRTQENLDDDTIFRACRVKS